MGWTWEYLHEGVAWSLVQRMMIDAPSYDTSDDSVEEVTLSENNADQIRNFVNSLM